MQKAEDMKKQTSSGCEEFDFGVKLYERGRYADSEKMLRTALDISGARAPSRRPMCLPPTRRRARAPFLRAHGAFAARLDACGSEMQGRSRGWAATSRSSWRWR